MYSAKSTRRVEILRRVMDELKTPEVFKTLNYRQVGEDKVKTALYPHLIHEITKIYETYKGYKEDTAKEKAKKNLLYEGNVQTTVNHVLFLGTFHRPDLVLKFDHGFNIAIEIKMCERGDDVRNGVGQSMVYMGSEAYDFTLLLMVDITEDKRILNSLNSDKEKLFLEKLWFESNILVDVV